jgi:hypothetical protein
VTITERLLEVCDAAAAALVVAAEPAEPDEIVRDYVTEDELATLEGKRTFVFPAGCAQVARLSRSEVVNEYRVAVRVVERYTDPGRPTREWVDERVVALGSEVYAALDRIDPTDYLLGTLWAETIEVADAANPDAILGAKLFWAEVEVAFREQVAG